MLILLLHLDQQPFCFQDHSPLLWPTYFVCLTPYIFFNLDKCNFLIDSFQFLPFHTVYSYITLSTKVHRVKAVVFPVVMYGCESWTVKKAECQRIDAFELWCWRRLLKLPWTARRANQSILKEINLEYLLEGFDAEAEAPKLGQPDVKSRITGKDPDAGKD